VGINKAKTEKPALNLLDIKMTGLDGLEVCQLLKADPQTKDIPIVIITALERKDLAEKCIKVGAADLIRKPWEAAELEAKIKALLK
jgi:CheY-like chemotaxis protein